MEPTLNRTIKSDVLAQGFDIFVIDVLNFREFKRADVFFTARRHGDLKLKSL